MRLSVILHCPLLASFSVPEFSLEFSVPEPKQALWSLGTVIVFGPTMGPEDVIETW